MSWHPRWQDSSFQQLITQGGKIIRTLNKSKQDGYKNSFKKLPGVQNLPWRNHGFIFQVPSSKSRGAQVTKYKRQPQLGMNNPNHLWTFAVLTSYHVHDCNSAGSFSRQNFPDRPWSSEEDSSDNGLVDNNVISERKVTGLVFAEARWMYLIWLFTKLWLPGKKEQPYHVSYPVTDWRAVKNQTGSFWFWFYLKQDWKAHMLPDRG